MAYLVDIKPNWKRELKTALMYSVLFIVANLILPQLTIGFPYQKLASFANNFILACIFAPIGEELFFRYFLVNSLYSLRLAVSFIVVITSELFSLFHYSAYGASLAAQSASFIGALLFGVIVSIVAIRTKSVIPGIIIHFTFNTWLLIRTYFG